MNAFQSLGQVNSIAREISLADCPLRKRPRYSKIAKARSILQEAAFSLTGMIGTVIKKFRQFIGGKNPATRLPAGTTQWESRPHWALLPH